LKKVLVSGSSYGLGKSISELLIKSGYFVYGISRSEPNGELLENTNFKWLKADITKLDELEKEFQKIDKLDFLVNNVGVYSHSMFEEENFENIERLIDINIKGNVFVTKLCISKLVNNSRIVFINSIAGINHIIEESIYVASKHALKAFSNVLAKELRPKKIKITNIHPGGINTPLQINNPNKNKLLQPDIISNTILQIFKNPDIEYKSIILYPEVEEH